NGPDSFWRMLREGRDAVTEVPASRWDVDLFYDPAPGTPGKMYTRRSGFLDDVEHFDATFFGISPREAVRMDPQQRLLLEVVWEALEDADQLPERLTGTTTGVFVGVSSSDYEGMRLYLRDPANINLYDGTGVARSVKIGRASCR